MGVLGKEYIALKIAEHFDTKILIYERKMAQIQAIGYPEKYWTLE